jgi:hypothetical protein
MNGSLPSFLSVALLASLSPMSAASSATNTPTPVPAQPKVSTSAPSITVSATTNQATSASSTNAPAPATNATATDTNLATLTVRELPEIHGKISIPKDWTLLPGKLLEGDVLLATKEKVTSENDLWTTGLSMTVDRNGPKDSGQKPSEYARALAREAQEKAGEEATPIKESQSGGLQEFRFEFPVPADTPLTVTEVLRANDKTGELFVILWQMPKQESPKLLDLREAVLSSLVLGGTTP